MRHVRILLQDGIWKSGAALLRRWMKGHVWLNGRRGRQIGRIQAGTEPQMHIDEVIWRRLRGLPNVIPSPIIRRYVMAVSADPRGVSIEEERELLQHPGIAAASLIGLLRQIAKRHALRLAGEGRRGPRVFRILQRRRGLGILSWEVESENTTDEMWPSMILEYINITCVRKNVDCSRRKRTGRSPHLSPELTRRECPEGGMGVLVPSFPPRDVSSTVVPPATSSSRPPTPPSSFGATRRSPLLSSAIGLVSNPGRDSYRSMDGSSSSLTDGNLPPSCRSSRRCC